MSGICPYDGCNYESSPQGVKIHHAKIHDESLAKDEKICEVCGDEFETYVDARSCGRDCAGDIISQEKIVDGHIVECFWCDDDIRVPPWKYEWNNDRGLKFYCDLDCKADYQDSIHAEDHPNWKGGYSPNYGCNWSEIRNKVRDRDNSSCQICGVSKDELGKEPDVHHIKPIREFDIPEKANTMDNLVCLCSQHHQKVECGKIPCPEVNNE